MKILAKTFMKFNPSLFSFFSGICVSLALNIFTSILMDISKSFSILNIISVIFMLVGGGILIIESVLSQNYIEKIVNAKKIKMKMDEIVISSTIKNLVVKLSICIIASIVFIIIALSLLYLDFLNVICVLEI